jgi:hypothetical protein
MTDQAAAAVLDEVTKTGVITPELVLALRRTTYDDSKISATEADYLIRLDGLVRTGCREWSDYYTETITDYLVEQVEPHGYVDEAAATFVFEKIVADHQVKSETELELLVRIMERARSVPASFAARVLRVVFETVSIGRPASRLAEADPARITADEVQLLKRVLYAAGGPDGIAVSREEAEALFAIEDIVGSSDNAPEWADLFARAVGNHIVGALIHDLPSREEALRRQRWLDTETKPFEGFMARLVGGFSTDLSKMWGKGAQGLGDDIEEAYAEDNARDAAALKQGELISIEESEWVIRRIGYNGTLTTAELALVDFLRTERTSLPPALVDLIERLPRPA